MLTVVKLKIPSGGNCSSVFAVGLNAPSAPVLPLSKAMALCGISAAPRPAIKSRFMLDKDLIMTLSSTEYRLK
jgi:hypothetical protein